MENASKALLIAASVLIAILLIAMGVRVFTSTQGTVDSVDGTMQSTEITTFNNKFLAYVGSNKSAAQVKSLANVIIANNATNSAYTVSLNTKNTSTDITSVVANLSGRYDVSASFSTDGRINAITISQEGLSS